MPERRATLTCGVDLHKAVYRKGAESERTAVATTRFASFGTDGDRDKSGSKGEQNV
jgi:hypothetical protein